MLAWPLLAPLFLSFVFKSHNPQPTATGVWLNRLRGRHPPGRRYLRPCNRRVALARAARVANPSTARCRAPGLDWTLPHGHCRWRAHSRPGTEPPARGERPGMPPQTGMAPTRPPPLVPALRNHRPRQQKHSARGVGDDIRQPSPCMPTAFPLAHAGASAP